MTVVNFNEKQIMHQLLKKSDPELYHHSLARQLNPTGASSFRDRGPYNVRPPTGWGVPDLKPNSTVASSSIIPLNSQLCHLSTS